MVAPFFCFHQSEWELCFPTLKPIAEQIEDADTHDENGSNLTDCIAGKAHQEREDCAAEDAHNEQARDFVLLFWSGLQSSCKDDAERISVAEAHQSYARIDGCSIVTKDESKSGQYHQQNTQE